MTASSITALDGSTDNTSVTIEAGANGVTMATFATVGTGTHNQSNRRSCIGCNRALLLPHDRHRIGAVTATGLDLPM